METFSFPKLNRHQFQVYSPEFLSMKVKDKLPHMRQRTITLLFSLGSLLCFHSLCASCELWGVCFLFKLFLLVLASKSFLLDWIDIIHFSRVSLMKECVLCLQNQPAYPESDAVKLYVFLFVCQNHSKATVIMEGHWIYCQSSLLGLKLLFVERSLI